MSHVTLNGNADVVIVGGGLAGLTLALQLKRTHSELAVVVVERARHPVRNAAHKVGESTVEIGSHYLAEMLGLRDHLDREHLRKFGLRLFFGGETGETDIARLDELGASDYFSLPTYQIDRGVLENHLARELATSGVSFLDDHVVRRVDVASAGERHKVVVQGPQSETTLTCRWLIDAAGRAGPLRRQLGLASAVEHDNHAAWFRIDAQIRIDDFSDDADWQRRCVRPERWRSTNHFMGRGHWVWLIPLSSGCTSIGVVADPRVHPAGELGDFDAVMTWLARNQPLCAQKVEPVRDRVMDFLRLRQYAHGARKVFSADRWALTGDAGVFLDPFYSPGTDFIAISNTFITRLITEDLAGRLTPLIAAKLDLFYLSFFRTSLDLYRDLYPGFGSWDIMTLKTTWDYAYYWGVLGVVFFSGRMDDIAALESVQADLLRVRRMNTSMQAAFRAAAACHTSSAPAGRFLDQRGIPCLPSLNAALTAGLGAPGELARAIRKNAVLLETVARFCHRTLGDIGAPGDRTRRAYLTEGERASLGSLG